MEDKKRVSTRELRENLRAYLDSVIAGKEMLIYDKDSNTDYLLTADIGKTEGLNVLVECTYSDFRAIMKSVLSKLKDSENSSYIRVKSRNIGYVYVLKTQQTNVYIDRIEFLEKENERLKRQIKRLEKYKELIEGLNEK